MASWKKMVLVLVVVSSIAFGALSLTSCGPNAEEIVTQAITDEFEPIKAHDDATLDQLAAYEGADSLAAYGVDAKEFLASFLDGFDYRVNEVTADGKSVTASVTFTCKSFSAFAEALTQGQEALAADESIANLGEEELNLRVGQMATEALESVTSTEKLSIKFEFSRQNGTWAPTKDAQQVLEEALLSS